MKCKMNAKSNDVCLNQLVFSYNTKKDTLVIRLMEKVRQRHSAVFGEKQRKHTLIEMRGVTTFHPVTCIH